MLDRYATDILAVSEGTMVEAWCADWPADPRCRVIFNGLDTSRFEARSPDDVRREFGWARTTSRIYINVASFQPAKNQLRVVDVFHHIAQRQAEARLCWSAGGERLPSERARGGRASRPGRQSDVRRRACRRAAAAEGVDVLLFPSKWEGLPGAVLESCAAGLPVVASDIPGVLEIGRHFPTVRAVSLTESDARVGGAGDRGGTAPREHRRTRSRTLHSRSVGRRRRSLRLRESQLGHADCLVLLVASGQCGAPARPAGCARCSRHRAAVRVAGRAAWHLRAERRPDTPLGLEPRVMAARRAAALRSVLRVPDFRVSCSTPATPCWR